MNLNKYKCNDCNKKFFTPANELNANYCPYCNSDDIWIEEDYIDLNYKKEK